ncbi:MAG: hypothetical protein QOE05_3412 [Actinomycetota bacterium]|jgi:hypothetical protein|nr:hypothetical protein [Actinomycetota bacterium]
MSTTLTVDLASAVARDRQFESARAIAVHRLAIKGRRRQQRATARRLRLARLAIS